MYERYAYPDELYHYGVKGMEWGKRKKQYTDYMNQMAKKYDATYARTHAAMVQNQAKRKDTATKAIKSIGSNSAGAVKSLKGTAYKGPTSAIAAAKKGAAQSAAKKKVSDTIIGQYNRTVSKMTPTSNSAYKGDSSSKEAQKEAAKKKIKSYVSKSINFLNDSVEKAKKKPYTGPTSAKEANKKAARPYKGPTNIANEKEAAKKQEAKNRINSYMQSNKDFVNNLGKSLTAKSYKGDTASKEARKEEGRKKIQSTYASTLGLLSTLGNGSVRSATEYEKKKKKNK